MSVSMRHLRHQGPVIQAMWGELLRLQVRRFLPKGPVPSMPGPDLEAVVPPRPGRLIDDLIEWSGGDRAAWGDHLPFYLHPQWGFPLAVATLRGLPFPMSRALNVGCSTTMHAPISRDAPLTLCARLDAIDQTDRRVLLHQKLWTGPSVNPQALEVDYQVLVPLPRPPGAPRGPKPERPHVPQSSREVARWSNGAKAGLEFALLTGDFNPIHWIGPAAKIAGFKAQILHGFGSAARTAEALIAHTCDGVPARLKSLSMRFTSPVVLPSDAALFLGEDGSFTVGLEPGGVAFFAGSYEVSEPAESKPGVN